MIGSLRGRVTETHAGFFLLEVQGVGYLLKASAPTMASVTSGEERLFYIHDHVREDARDLFGFASWSEKELFERLLSVSGVGPKVALTILSVGSSDTVRRAIQNGDLALLTSVPGVGTKTAQKIILDLKGKLVEEQGLPPGDAEVIEALMSLGYSAPHARKALASVSREVTDVSARVREALRQLSP
jgi:holliday junction DNA helicase RuvA